VNLSVEKVGSGTEGGPEEGSETNETKRRDDRRDRWREAGSGAEV